MPLIYLLFISPFTLQQQSLIVVTYLPSGPLQKTLPTMGFSFRNIISVIVQGTEVLKSGSRSP